MTASGPSPPGASPEQALHSAGPWTLSQWQEDLAAFALHEDAAAGDRLLQQLSTTPVPAAVALQIHVDCVHTGLRSALAQRVPTVVALVGEAFFQLLARDFARAYPPSRPQLSCWGEELPHFLQTRDDCAAFPWLGEVAAFDLAIDRIAWSDPALPERREMEFRYAVDELREAVSAALVGDESALAKVDLSPAPRRFVLWCADDAVVRCRKLDPMSPFAVEPQQSSPDLP